MIDLKKIKELYSSFDGNMPECLGGDCPTPCCNVKSTLTYGSGPVEYMTSLVSRAELELQKTQLENNDILSKEYDLAIYGGSPDIRALIKGCLGEDGCKLAEIKPLQCRIYPFSINHSLSLRTECPQAKEIASNKKTVDHMLKIRTLLGKTNNEEWLRDLRKRIDELSITE